MMLRYDTATDSLYIDLNERHGLGSREVADGIVVDFDAAGRAVGIDIQHASEIVDLNHLDVGTLPLALSSPRR